MATNISLLAYLTRNTEEQFPEPFRLVSDPDLYTFKTQILQDGTTFDMVHVGLYDINHNTKDRKPLWSRIAGDVAEYYYEVKSQLSIVDDGDRTLYPLEGSIRHKDGPGPFDFVAPGKWSSSKDVKHGERKQTRARLECLIRLAFILTGRTTLVTYRSNADMLWELRQLCLYLFENQKDETRRPAQRVAKDDDDDDGNGEYQTALYPRGRASMPPRAGFLKNKRTADEMEGVEVERGVRNLRNRVTDMSISPPRHGRMLAPRPFQDSGVPQNMFNDLVERITVQVQEEWAAEKDELYGQIEALQAELADSRTEAREGDDWKKKYQQLTESLEGMAAIAREEL
ncbi:hypothetical protein E8E11_008762 [Didymella keratinophila]|nr:hypothetical protein E8E11_008762 [Didymella keratinophila]